MNKFFLESNWLTNDSKDELERSFYAEIGVSVQGNWLTLLENLIETGVVSTHLKGCSYQLALWFASNWWRLRWEPSYKRCLMDVDWLLAHRMSSAGGGYVWPKITFSSDGESLGITSQPSESVPYESVRYLVDAEYVIEAGVFEAELDRFIQDVIDRGRSQNVSNSDLLELWAEVLEERQDPITARWRKLEAICGYDPDQAPNEMLESLIADVQNFGSEALEELAAQERHDTLVSLETIRRLKSSQGSRVVLPELISKPLLNSNSPPWHRAVQVARQARTDWQLGNNPVTDNKLAELLQTSPGELQAKAKGILNIPIAIQQANAWSVYLHRPQDSSRRFDIARLIGDHICYGSGGRLLPASNTDTARQKFQRAFAQEFLCPIEGILEHLQTENSDDDVNETAKHFKVSAMMVQHALINNHRNDLIL